MAASDVLRLGVDADADVGVVADVAVVARLRDRRREGVELEIGLLSEGRDVPRAGRIDGGLAEGEEVLRVGVFLRLVAVAHIGRPGRELREGRRRRPGR